MSDVPPTTNIERAVKGLGLATQAELLRWVPKAYRDYRTLSGSIRDCEGKGRVPLSVIIVGRMDYARDGSRIVCDAECRAFRIAFRVRDVTGFECWMAVIGAVVPWNNVVEGDTVSVFAEVKEWNGSLQLKAPELIPVQQVGKMVPLYRGKRGKLSAGIVSAAVGEIFCDQLLEAEKELIANIGLPEHELLRLADSRFASLREFFSALHRPADSKDAFRALSDAKTFSAIHLQRMARRVNERRATPAAALKLETTVVVDLIKSLPFRLTADQHRAVWEIVADLAKDRVMRRLLSGDVCTGKTIAFLIPAIAAIQSGAVVAIICPSVLLANQLVEEATLLFPRAKTVLVTSVKRKNLVPGALLIGTTALIAAVGRSGLVPDLLICDEQQRLGRGQREALLGEHTNLLEATATAIPRTVALVTHGGLDVSVLRESTVEKHIVTRLVTPESREDLFEFLVKIARTMGQIAIIYPRVAEEGGRKSSVAAAEKQWEKLFPGQVVTLHGKLSEDAKLEALTAMKSGQKRILIASSVIEVGVTIKGLRGVMVVAPDCYGVGQLHQIRGRLARDGGKAYMFLYLTHAVNDYDADTIDRLRLVESEPDGFALAEKDAYARGFGDLSEDGDLQNGSLPTLFYGIRLKPEDLLDV